MKHECKSSGAPCPCAGNPKLMACDLCRDVVSVRVWTAASPREQESVPYVSACVRLGAQHFSHEPTCVVWMMVRSFMQATPAPMAALRPAVPNSILEEKHFLRPSTSPPFTSSSTVDTVLGF